MNITIVEPKIIKQRNVVYSPVIEFENDYTPEMLSIELNSEYTRIDFICYAKSKNWTWEWISILPDTFVRPFGTDLKLKLVNVMNLPVSPRRHYFKNKKDVVCYTLYFPKLPGDVKKIDIIESECSGRTWFNFYGVSVEKIATEKLMVMN